MLLQSPLGSITSFVYTNSDLFDAMHAVAESQISNEEIVEVLGKDMLYKLETVGTACRNNSVRGCISNFLKLHQKGIKGIAPDAKLADSMALTEANYNAEDFRMPYDRLVIEIPKECRGHVRLDRESFSDGTKELYEDAWGIDLNHLFTVGAEIKYIIVSEIKYEEPKYVKEFEGYAESQIDIEIITSEFLKSELVKPIPNNGRARRDDGYITSWIFNPSPVSFYGRPLVKGRTVEELISKRVWREDNSPGAIKHRVSDNIVADLRWPEQPELDYMINATRMALNLIFALVNMGFDEEMKVSSQKLIHRGSKEAKRVIPDVLSPATLINSELKKFKYESIGEGGGSVRPHFRRGHWRNQRHGPELQQIKNVWIMPTIVNKKLLRAGAEDNVFKTTQT